MKVPLFVTAFVVLVMAVGLEFGARWLVPPATDPAIDPVVLIQSQFEDDPPSADEIREDLEAAAADGEVPGYGIPHLALVDAILLMSMTWMLLSIVGPRSIQARVQGLVSLIVGLLLLLGCIVLVLLTLAKLIVMIMLVGSGPFGFLAYMAVWGSFDKSTAKLILSFSMSFKIAFAVLLVLAHPPFLKVKSMVLLIVTSLVLTLVTVFLIGLVPSFLASITDAVAGIINALAAAIWSVVVMVMSLISVRRALPHATVLSSREG